LNGNDEQKVLFSRDRTHFGDAPESLVGIGGMLLHALEGLGSPKREALEGVEEAKKRISFQWNTTAFSTIPFTDIL
jgi:hypothetical protein